VTEKKEELHLVYGVSRGEYSDYEVAAIFSTREKAEAYAARSNAICPYCKGKIIQADGQLECSECHTLTNRHQYEWLNVESFPLDPEEIIK